MHAKKPKEAMSDKFCSEIWLDDPSHVTFFNQSEGIIL